MPGHDPHPEALENLGQHELSLEHREAGADAGSGAGREGEDRWVRIDSVPEVLDADLASVSANEWLVRNVPFVRGDIEFGAVAASAMEAAALGTSPGAALFLVQRATWNPRGLITAVRLTYAPGYRMHATL